MSASDNFNAVVLQVQADIARHKSRFIGELNNDTCMLSSSSEFGGSGTRIFAYLNDWAHSLKQLELLATLQAEEQQKLKEMMEKQEAPEDEAKAEAAPVKYKASSKRG